jgi:RsiW-degrading membrane proteinase PrsW (M82 family)
MVEEVIILCSLLVGFAVIHYLRAFDFYEPEPYWTMLLATLLGGSCAVVISIYMYDEVAGWGVHQLENAIGAFFVIAPIEEMAKLFGLLAVYPFIRRHLNEPIDGIIYIACVALGFSLVENFFYIVNSNGLWTVVTTRLLLSTPMHISFSVLMGLGVFCLIEYQAGWRLLFVAFAYACVMHGLFNLIIFNEYIAILLLGLVLLAHFWTLTLLGFTSAISPFRVTLKQFLTQTAESMIDPGLECLQCGDSQAKPAVTSGALVIQRCTQCGSYVCSKDVLYKLFYRFGARVNRLATQVIEHDGTRQGLTTLYAGNYYSDKKAIAVFGLDELDGVLEKSREITIQKMLGKLRFLFAPLLIDQD